MFFHQRRMRVTSLVYVWCVVTLTACVAHSWRTPAMTAEIPQDLVIYSGRTEALIMPVIQAFRNEYPHINVILKSGKNNELAAAILEERTQPQADIFLSTDMLTHINLSADDVFVAEPIAGTAHIPAHLKDAAGRWTSVTSRARVIMYNTSLVSATDAPTSMFDLTHPRWYGQVAIADSSNGPMQAQVASMIALVGEAATRTWLTGLVANNATFFASATDLRKAVGSGEFAIGVANHYHYLLQQQETTNNTVAAIYPDQADGQIGVMMNTSTVARIAGSPHPDAARIFAEYLFRPDIQTLFATVNMEFAVIPEVARAPHSVDLRTLRIAAVDMQQAATGAPQAVKLMQSVGIP